MITPIVSVSPRLTVDRRWIKPVIDGFNKLYPTPGTIECSIVLVGDAKIRNLNRIYRDKDRVTDVLSFAQENKATIIQEQLFGEIVICLPQARRQAKQAGHSLTQELQQLLIHALAHISGYEHEGVSEKTKNAMARFEDLIWQKVQRQKAVTRRSAN